MNHKQLKSQVVTARACAFVALGEIGELHPAYKEVFECYEVLSRLLEEVEQMPILWNQQVINHLMQEEQK